MSGVSEAEHEAGTGCFSPEALWRAYLDCRRRKRGTKSALLFAQNAGENLLRLSDELTGGTYRPLRSVCFITTYPKPREIFAAEFRDRIVHHLLVREIEPYWEKVFIHDSFACRKGKGTHAAVERLSHFIQQITRGRRKRAYYLQLDVKNFFMSIDRRILFRQLERGLEKQFRIPRNRLPLGLPQYKEYLAWRELAEQSVFHDPVAGSERRSPDEKWSLVPPEKSLFNCPVSKGLPIGNLTSQFFANVYLNALDRFVKHTLKARFYIRYVDDLVLLHEDRETLRRWLGEIREFLKKRLSLELKSDVRLRPVSCGINFLGYIQHPTHRLVRRRVVGAFERKLTEVTDLGTARPMIASYRAHFEKADSWYLFMDILGRYLRQHLFK